MIHLEQRFDHPYGLVDQSDFSRFLVARQPEDTRCSWQETRKQGLRILMDQGIRVVKTVHLLHFLWMCRIGVVAGAGGKRSAFAW